MKNDARVRYTKMRIRDAFCSAITKKNIDKITVKEICDAAEINRATFYYHYTDLYALNEEMQMETITKFTAFVKNKAFQSSSIEEAICMILQVIEKNFPTNPMLDCYKQDEAFLEKFADYFMEEFADEICSYYSAYSPEERRILYQFAAKGAGAAVAQWLKDNMSVSKEMVAKLIADRLG